jgi:hypothetical protein
MAADRSIQSKTDMMPTKPAAMARRQFLRGIGLALLPVAALGFSSCTAPKYDRDRGLWVLRPKK